MDSFTIYKFICTDKRAPPLYKDKTYIFYGNDDNSAIYQGYETHGGRGLFHPKVTGAKTYHQLYEEMKAKGLGGAY